MRFFELLQRVKFEDMVPTLKDFCISDRQPFGQLAYYKQAFDCLCLMKPEINDDTMRVGTSDGEGDFWAKSLGKTIVYNDGLPSNDAVVAAHFLWNCTFYGFKPVVKWSNKLRVWSDKVPHPVAVRYCFTNWCEGSLYNNYGFPAAPFRTDDWPLEWTKPERNTAVSLFSKADSLQVREYSANGADQYFSVGHHGPAVENTRMACRIYYNGSGAIDVYTKSGAKMELRKYLWHPSEEQQLLEGAGCDEYFVGNTVGLGGVRLWDGMQEQRFDSAERSTARVGEYEGGAFAELCYYNVNYKGSKVDVSIRIDMSNDSPIATVTATELNGKEVQFVTGINYHSGAKIKTDEEHVEVCGTHPANVTQHPTPIEAGIWFEKDCYSSIEQLPDRIQLISKPSTRIKTRIMAQKKECDSERKRACR